MLILAHYKPIIVHFYNAVIKQYDKLNKVMRVLDYYVLDHLGILFYNYLKLSHIL